MRQAFFGELKDKDVTILTAVLGYYLFKNFKNVLNVGVAEQNMIGIAAGMAISGRKVYCYSIIPFLVMRTYEQIRIDIAYNNLPVTLVGTGIDNEYGREGCTHYGFGDLEIMRTLENFIIWTPDSACSAKRMAKQSLLKDFPLYIRLRSKP